MKWVCIEHNGTPAFGILEGEVIALTTHRWEDVLAGKAPETSGEINLAGARLLAPVGRPGKIIAIGLNYMDHIRETGGTAPERPLIFTKFTTAIANPGDDIVWSTALTDAVDFEAELAAVIGQTCRHVDRADALDYVLGYTAANDVSARDLQFSDGQWIRGKSLDTFCPLGPALVTADEIPNPQALGIRCFLNGERMQDSHTGEMLFGVADLVAFCSQAFTLEPGDVILTGTPHGVGIGRDPKVYLQDGDEVVVEIDAIGRLENRCRVV